MLLILISALLQMNVKQDFAVLISPIKIVDIISNNVNILKNIKNLIIIVLVLNVLVIIRQVKIFKTKEVLAIKYKFILILDKVQE